MSPCLTVRLLSSKAECVSTDNTYIRETTMTNSMPLYISERAAIRVVRDMHKHGIKARILRKRIREADGSVSIGYAVYPQV